MYNNDEKDYPKFSQQEEQNDQDIVANNTDDQDSAEDTDPPLDEEDLEENGLSVEEADQVVWDTPKTGSAGGEEKDIAV